MNKRRSRTLGTLSEDIKSEMNFVPFIDIMLVLLIVFIVVAQTPKSESKILIKLPQVSLGNSEQKMEKKKADTLVVTLSKNKIFVSNPFFEIVDVEKTPSDLSVFSAALKKKRPNTDVYVRADRDLKYKNIVEVMDLIKAQGFEKINLVTENVEVRK